MYIVYCVEVSLLDMNDNIPRTEKYIGHLKTELDNTFMRTH